MPKFEYKAKSSPEEIKTGVIEAENDVVAAKALRQKGLYPLSITQVSKGALKTHPRKLRSRELSAFTRQLANLLRSGFTLPRALQTLLQQTQRPPLKTIVEELNQKINKGNTFSESLRAYPKIFTPFYVSMVQVGEKGGRLDEALEKLADSKEKEEEIISQVKSALAYPSFLLAVGIATIFVLITFVIPRISVMFSDFEQVLPLPTQIVVVFSAFMARYWWIVVISFCCIFLFARLYYAVEKNRLYVDGVLLRVPGIKSLIQKIEIANFTHALGVLLSNGITMLDSLKVVASSVGNRQVRKKCLSFSEQIRKGQSLSSCFAKDTFFPIMLTNMVGVGEESGDVAGMLLKVAHEYENEAAKTVKTLVSLLEPALILILGAVIGFLAFSMLLPIFQINLLVE